MDRNDYLRLRDAPKVIRGDIRFRLGARIGDNMRLEQVSIDLVPPIGVRLVLDGWYRPVVDGVTFNVVADGVAICRLDVRGQVHKDQGRTHKHELRTARCAQSNLPHAVARQELDGLDAEACFLEFCQKAHITDEGRFISPAVLRT